MSFSRVVSSMVLTGFLSAAFLLPASADSFQRDALRVTHGVTAGDVTSNSAVIWSRADRTARMNVQILGKGNDAAHLRSVQVDADSDYTGKVVIDGLKPDTEYRYQVWFGDEANNRRRQSSVEEGRFRTAPVAHQPRAVRFAWGGDLAGQNTCRDQNEGFPIFNAINRMGYDFFIGHGDMIYADGVCEATGRYGNAQVVGDFVLSHDLPNFWAHWKYNREDDGYRKLLASMPYYAIWDDHEVVNDFGPLHDTRDTAPYTAGVKLLPLGLKAFLDYNAIAEHTATPKRLYRNIRWGQHMEMFILDTRQYRDANFMPDNAAASKTMLGREQMVWLKQKLSESDATWKIIVSSVPMAIPTGSAGAAGRDGWANYLQDGGFEYELVEMLRFMQQQDMRNVVFITTDVHFAEVFRFTPFVEAPGFQIHEFVSGPLNAGLFPNRAYDTTLNAEPLFFFGANNAADVTTWQQAKSWFNYGEISITEYGRLIGSIKDIDGKTLYQLGLDPH